MNNPKLRNLLINLHLIFAAFLAPAFLLVAISGGNYLIGNKGKLETTPLTVPAGVTLNFDASDKEAELRRFLDTANIDHKFEYVVERGGGLMTRPFSRPYVFVKPTDNGVEAVLNSPDLQKSMMELHMGHGPLLFKTYQKIVALGLIGVVLGGLLVGLLAKAYRRRTIIMVIAGTVIFFILALLA